MVITTVKIFYIKKILLRPATTTSWTTLGSEGSGPDLDDWGDLNEYDNSNRFFSSSDFFYPEYMFCYPYPKDPNTMLIYEFVTYQYWTKQSYFLEKIIMKINDH